MDIDTEEVREVRKPTPYNAFIKLNLQAFQIKNPNVSNKDAVLELARIWTAIKTPEMTADNVPKIF
jgi:hypothetical protein